MSAEPNAYDAVRYPGHTNPATHPNNLAVMGILHGLEPAPVEGCRVLEIGCSEGRNLIPMAYASPGAQFVGIDLAESPVRVGQQAIRGLGLRNIELRQADLMDLDESFGSFDYIIAHGVYTWVPQFVRDRLLAVCRQLLAPQGIVFISYNTLPGGHFRRSTRQILQHFQAQTGDPLEDVRQSINFLQFILQSRPEGDPFRAMLEVEIAQLRRKGPYVTFHDELETSNLPVSFSDFAAHAAANGLQFLCEASLAPPGDPSFDQEIVATARALSRGDRIAEEQTYDLIRNRMYRQTLLCHAERDVERSLNLGFLERLRFASPAVGEPVVGEPVVGEPVAAHATSSGIARVFRLEESNCMRTEHPGLILAMDRMSEAWPRSITLAELRPLFEEQGISFDVDFLLRLFRQVAGRMVELRAWEPPVPGVIPDRPRTSELCRHIPGDEVHAPSLLHTGVAFSDELLRDFVGLADGTRDRAQLLEALRRLHPGTDEETLVAGLEPALNFLQRSGVLLAEDFAGTTLGLPSKIGFVENS